jgi:hypothetical protein
MFGVGALGGIAAQGGVAARGDVGALGGVSAQGGVGTLGGVVARGGVGTLGGVGTWGVLCALYRRASGISSFSSSSLVKLAMTLCCFQLLSSLSIIKGPSVPRGSVDFLFWEGPSTAGRFLTAFLVTRGSRASTPTGQSSVGTLEMYTVVRSWPWILQGSD